MCIMLATCAAAAADDDDDDDVYDDGRHAVRVTRVGVKPTSDEVVR